MSNYMPASERTIYSGICSDPDCMTSIAIWPHWERPTDLPEPEDWEGFFHECPVCGSTMNLDFTDPMTPTIRPGHAPHRFEEDTDE